MNCFFDLSTTVNASDVCLYPPIPTLNSLDGNIGKQTNERADLAHISNIDPSSSDDASMGNNIQPVSYAKLLNGEQSRKSVNFCTFLELAGNGVDIAISIELVCSGDSEKGFLSLKGVRGNGVNEMQSTLSGDPTKDMNHFFGMSTTVNTSDVCLYPPIPTLNSLDGNIGKQTDERSNLTKISSINPYSSVDASIRNNTEPVSYAKLLNGEQSRKSGLAILSTDSFKPEASNCTPKLHSLGTPSGY
ncbi:hypothetical protein Tco_1074847 [Tanacetum coccineum]